MGMTQAVLAEKAGCTQSAVCMMERGKLDAIARPTLEKLASILGVKLPEEVAEAGVAAATLGPACCPNPDCPSNVPVSINGETVLWPRLQKDAKYCVYCGEVLEHSCRKCSAPISEGAFCPECGEARVPAPADSHTAEWVEGRRREIAEWRSLI